MKTIKVTIFGDLQVIDYCTTDLDFLENYNQIFHWEKLESITVDDGEENVIKQKGKYVKTKEYLHNLFNTLPVECHTRTYYRQSCDYMIELEDAEDFDIKKLQIVKSFETDTDIYPYLIVGAYILYDGKQFDAEESIYDYCPEDKIHNEFIIKYLVDRDR